MTEDSITQALLDKYGDKFVCVPQCKTGPTWYSQGLGIIDLWVMSKSWAHPLVIAHEIKVSRSDFLNDRKAHDYMAFCNELYFVVPSTDIAKPEEMPEHVGLMVLSKTGNKIFVKKKAAYRNMTIPEEIYRYILMQRAVITKEKIHNSKLEFWREWLKNKEINHAFGYRVAETLSRRIREEVFKAQEINDDLKHENDLLSEIKTYLESIGIDWHDICKWNYKEKLSARLEELKTGLSNQTANDISNCIEALTRIREEVIK